MKKDIMEISSKALDAFQYDFQADLTTGEIYERDIGFLTLSAEIFTQNIQPQYMLKKDLVLDILKPRKLAIWTSGETQLMEWIPTVCLKAANNSATTVRFFCLKL